MADFSAKKFGAVERAFFSIRRIGLHSGLIHPECLGFIYRQFCQSIYTYGLEVITLSKSLLKNINTRQGILLKLSLGLPKFSRNTLLLRALGVLSISELYTKSKIQFLEQIKKNGLADSVYERLLFSGMNNKGCRQSFFHQLKELEIELNKNPIIANKEERWLAFNKIIEVPEELRGLVDSVKTVFARWHHWSMAREQLCLLLRVTFEEKRVSPVSGAECDELSELLSYLEELDGDET